MPPAMAEARAQWQSKLGFILAAAGSAVGLGNLWKFPYVTGTNGGGAFVLIYLVCIALVGLPIMLAEVTLGRMAQTGPVGAFRAASKPFVLFGGMGIVAAFVILSYYSVVAGWSLHYIYLSLTGAFSKGTPETIPKIFGALASDPVTTTVWHTVFMVVTIALVYGGVQRGVERAARIMMPTLFLLMIVLLGYATTLDGFGRAFTFVFGFHTDALTAAGVLEALGHSFFTLSLGMGAMLTYGSYLSKHDDLISASAAITVLDTLVALMACLVLFPITFTYGMEPAAGPGLVFVNMPVAFNQLPGTSFWSLLFFVLLFFAALTSAISLLEVAAAYFIDERGWARHKAVLFCGIAIFLLGVPSALANGTELFGAQFAAIFGHNWLDAFDYLASNWMLPLGGLGIAIVMAYRVGDEARRTEIALGSELGGIRAVYLGWLQLLRYVVPLAIILVMLHALKVF